MKEKIVLCIMFTLILTGTFAFEAQQTKLITAIEKTWYVGPPPSDFAGIQEAINNESVLDGHVIEVKWNATPYYENVTVYKSVKIRHYSSDPPGYYPTVDGRNGKGVVFNVTAPGVEIDGFIIQNGGCGILLTSSNNNVCNNTVVSNSRGIHIARESANNILRSNKMSGNIWNFGIEHYRAHWNTSISIEHFIQDIDVSNTVEGKPIYYWVNKTGGFIPSNAGYVAIVNSTNVTVENLFLPSNYQGVLVAYSSGIMVKNLQNPYLSWLNYGVVFVNVNTSTIQNTNLEVDNCFIDLRFSKDNTIKNNKLTPRYSSLSTGISLDWADNNVIADNVIKGYFLGQPTGVGIYLKHSLNNTIIANNITSTFVSLGLDYSNGTIIFHNNFWNNVNKPILVNSFNNRFDNGYEGNYWSDYDGKDGNGDGIGDTPYPIGVDRDNHPLIEPWSALRMFRRNMTIECPPAYSMKLYSYSNSTLASWNFNTFDKQQISYYYVSKGAITLNATSGYDGFLNITIPRNWLDGNFTVKIDKIDVSNTLILSMNSTHSSIYITYERGTHMIEIIGEKAGNIVGDLDGDGRVGLSDLVMLARNYGAQQ